MVARRDTLSSIDTFDREKVENVIDLIVAVESFLGKFLVCVNIHHMTSCSVEA